MLPDSAGSRPPTDPGAVADLGLSVDVQVATGPRVLPWLRRRVRLQRRAQQKLTMEVSPRIDQSHARRTTHATLPTYGVFRILPFVLMATLAVTSSGCGNSKPSSSDPKSRVSGTPTADLGAPGSVLILNCDNTSGSVRLTLTAVSADDGRQIATNTTRLAGGGPSFICGDPTAGYYPSSQVLPQLFDRDYAQVAGWIAGPSGEGALATAFDLRNGAPVGPGLDPGTFAASPADSRPVFHDGKLWYVDRDKRLRSRAPDQAPNNAQDHGPADDHEMIIADGVPWYGAEPYTAAVHPSGQYAAEFDHFWGNLRVRKRGARDDDAVVLSEGTAAGADKPPTGSASVSPCAPNFWFDDHTLICSSENAIWKLTLAPGLGSVAKAEQLLPATNRKTYGAVPAPGRRQFAFLSKLGNTTTVYRQSLSHEGTPTKIADVPTSGATYLVMWH